MSRAVDGVRLLDFCFKHEAILVGNGTRAPLSAKELVFVFPTVSRKRSLPGISSPFVRAMINEFYPDVHPDLKEHKVTVTANFPHNEGMLKTVQLQDSDHQYRLDHSSDSFCFSYSRIRPNRTVRDLFGCKVFMNLDH
jgi:hypothetical protein